jgi:pimeloyl-ACP methyl ester carboxylesterase
LKNISLIITVIFFLGQSNLTEARALDKLSPCHVDGIQARVLCGVLEVPENRDNPNQKLVPLNIVVLPSIQKSPQPDPLFFLAGGPGQAATELAATVQSIFAKARQERDIVLIDQRGTGKSNPLKCEPDTLENEWAYDDTKADIAQELTDCLATLGDYDLSQYSTKEAIRDFDAVRQHLGYTMINLYGGSYGTRAALVYMKMFPETLRSVVLDSVAPTQVVVGPFGKFGARAYDMMLADCAAQPSCLEAFPDLAKSYQTLFQRLETKPALVKMPDPVTSDMTEVLITANKVANSMRLALYSTTMRKMMPLIIDQAAKENYAPLVGFISASAGGGGMYIGLTFNILCSEDMPRATDSMIASDIDNHFIKDKQTRLFVEGCKVWPKFTPPEGHADPVNSDIPTFILSGTLDPVTPPVWGDLAKETLSNSRHFVVKTEAHTPIGSTCANKLVAEFLNDLDLTKIDDSCLEQSPTKRFLVNANGTGK